MFGNPFFTFPGAFGMGQPEEEDPYEQQLRVGFPEERPQGRFARFLGGGDPALAAAIGAAGAAMGRARSPMEAFSSIGDSAGLLYQLRQQEAERKHERDLYEAQERRSQELFDLDVASKKSEQESFKKDEDWKRFIQGREREGIARQDVRDMGMVQAVEGWLSSGKVDDATARMIKSDINSGNIDSFRNTLDRINPSESSKLSIENARLINEQIRGSISGGNRQTRDSDAIRASKNVTDLTAQIRRLQEELKDPLKKPKTPAELHSRVADIDLLKKQRDISAQIVEGIVTESPSQVTSSNSGIKEQATREAVAIRDNLIASGASKEEAIAQARSQIKAKYPGLFS